MGKSFDRKLATACYGVTIVTGILVALDLPLLTGSTIVEYRDPYSTDPVALLLNGPFAPYVHLVLFIGSLTLYLRLRTRD